MWRRDLECVVRLSFEGLQCLNLQGQTVNVTPLGLFDPEDKGTIILRNVCE
jgi:hypothetical protein